MTEREGERIATLEAEMKNAIKEQARQAEQIKMIWRAAFGVLSGIALIYFRKEGLL